MKGTFRTSWRRFAPGITLIEVLAGAAILGTLLVAILVAGARLNVQRRRASQRLTACEIADGLLEAWWDERKDFPRSDSRPVADHEGWMWRTRSVDTIYGSDVNAEVIALEVFAQDHGEDAEPAVQVAILLPLKNREGPKRTNTD